MASGLMLASGWVIVQVCATPQKDGDKTSSAGEVVNGYYTPANGTYYTSTLPTIVLSKARGTRGAFVAGDRALIIHMQCVDLNMTDTYQLCCRRCIAERWRHGGRGGFGWRSAGWARPGRTAAGAGAVIERISINTTVVDTLPAELGSLVFISARHGHKQWCSGQFGQRGAIHPCQRHQSGQQNGPRHGGGRPQRRSGHFQIGITHCDPGCPNHRFNPHRYQRRVECSHGCDRTGQPAQRSPRYAAEFER